MNILENITLRVRGIRRIRSMSDSQSNISQIENETLDDTAASLPERGNDDTFDHELISKLKEQVDQLTLQLCSAEEEIEILTLENSNLKQSNQELEKKNELYKKITNTPTKKTKQKSSTPKKREALLSKTTQTDQVNISDKKKNSKGTQTIATDTKVSSTGESAVSPAMLPTKSYNENPEKKVSKICIISENKYNKVRTIAENKFENCELCHYLTPYSGINNMFRDLELKLKKFTMNDFCIVLIGETDFKSTKEYSSIILYIRTVLEKIQHTNVVICMPTYRCISNVTLFNIRVEKFNNLLYQDILAHEHAYFIDSNKNLTWDYKMYRQNSGSVNNYGMQTVFQDIAALMNYIRENTFTNIEGEKINNMNEQQTTMQFFRS